MKAQSTVVAESMPRAHIDGPSMRVFNSKDLLDDSSEILIDHHGQFYRLKLTRQGKLILTK